MTNEEKEFLETKIAQLPIAGMGWRTLAFFADSVLLLLLIVGLTMTFCGNELSELADVIQKSIDEAERAIFNGTYTPEFSQKKAEEIALLPAAQTLSSFTLWCSTLIPFAYFFVGEFFFAGTSLGKRIFRIKSVSVTSEKLGVVQCILRAIWKTFTFMPLNLWILIIVVVNAYVPFFSKYHRGWHDKTSGTVVVNAR